MSQIKQSLTRKLGPLPAWAWALIAGAAIYIYRTRREFAASPATASAVTPSQTDAGGSTGGDTGSGGGGAGPTDPVVLGPGESVYNPATGQLLGTAPEQQAPGEPPLPAVPMDPLTLQPGEAVYDPNSGTLLRNAAPAATRAQTGTAIKAGRHAGHSRGHDYYLPGTGWVSKARYQAGTKRAKTPKVKHGETTHTPKPGSHKNRTRSPAKLLTPLRKKSKAKTSPPKGRARGNGNAAIPKPRVRATPKRTPALRQHPASHSAPRPRSAPRPMPLPAHRTEHKVKRSRRK